MVPHNLTSLAEAPTYPFPLSVPPEVRWFSIGRHGQTPRETYHFPGLWSLHFYRWNGVLEIDRVALPVQPGYVSVVPLGNGITHHFTGLSVHVAFLFAPMMQATPATGETVALSTMQDWGEDFMPVWERLEKVVAHGKESPRVNALLWELQWQVAERRTAGTPGSTGEHPAVQRVREIVELRLSEPLRVADLAQAVDLSHNHLTRLFQASVGQGVAQYIRERRVARATQLLRYSHVPIKVIAAQVGLPDLHQFNKVLRATTGLSPRALRQRSLG